MAKKDKEPEFIIVSAYDPIEEDLVIIRSWLDLPKLIRISGRVRVRIPIGSMTKDGKESMLDGYCALLKILSIRYDFHEEKPKEEDK